MVNGHRICHGGMIFSLADTTFACACNSWGPVTVAVNLSDGGRRFAAGPQASLAAASDPGIELTEHALVLPPDTVAVMMTTQEGRATR